MRKKARKLTEQATRAGLVPQQGGMGEKNDSSSPLVLSAPPPPNTPCLQYLRFAL